MPAIVDRGVERMKGRVGRVVLFLLLLLGIAAGVYYREQFNAALLQQWVTEAGMAGPLLFILLYVLATVLFLPGSILTLAGGAMFGPLWGTLYNIIGATLGSTLAFLLARYLASAWVERKSGGRLAQLKHGVEAEGWRFVAFVRLVPLFPFNALNYALGLTRIRLWPFFFASFVFMLPGTFAYTYLGYAGREALAGGEGLIRKGLLALALLALVAFLPRMVSRLRRGSRYSVEALQQAMEHDSHLVLLDVRDEEDYFGHQGHIAGAINIPLTELPARSEELAEFTEWPIAIIDGGEGNAAARAAQLLAARGYAHTHPVLGGMTAWREAGYPLVR